MKNQKLIKFVIIAIIFNSAFSGKVSFIEKDSKYENQIYLNFFSISNDSMTYQANGGEMKPLYQAFDDNSPEGWVSVGSQGEEYANINTKITYNPLINNITITFEKTSLINRMIYRAMVIGNDCPYIGYPKEFKIYYRMRNELGDFNSDLDDFILAEDIISNSTNKRVLFSFEKTIKCDQIKLEWNSTSYCSSFYNKRASAAEIKLLIPETENINENIINAFSDYNRFTLTKEFNDRNFINQLKNELIL